MSNLLEETLLNEFLPLERVLFKALKGDKLIQDELRLDDLRLT